MGGQGRILFGVSGWNYPDWAGVFYPANRPKGFSELEYAAGYFDALEINTSFYGPPRAQMARNWARRVEGREGFRFTAKLFQRFTHHRESPWTAAEAAQMKEGLAPLADAGVFGGLLAQFPCRFANDGPDRKWLEAVAAEFKEFPLFVEVRHDSWRKEEFFQYLNSAGIGFVDIDQPQIGKSSLPPVDRATGGAGYVRLHGRNYKAWFTEDAARNQRYDYLYDRPELAEWAGKIKKLASEAQEVFVFNNNHYRGQAAVNSLELKALVMGEKVEAPDVLVQAYPRLAEVVKRPRGDGFEIQDDLLS